MDRQDCQEYLLRDENDLPLPYPSHCYPCPYNEDYEILWLYHFDRDKYDQIVRLEANKLKRFSHIENNYGIFGLTPIPEVLEKAKKKYSHLSLAELDDRKKTYGHKVCSKW